MRPASFFTYCLTGLPPGGKIYNCGSMNRSKQVWPAPCDQLSGPGYIMGIVLGSFSLGTLNFAQSWKPTSDFITYSYESFVCGSTGTVKPAMLSLRSAKAAGSFPFRDQ